MIEWQNLKIETRFAMKGNAGFEPFDKFRFKLVLDRVVAKLNVCLELARLAVALAPTIAVARMINGILEVMHRPVACREMPANQVSQLWESLRNIVMATAAADFGACAAISGIANVGRHGESIMPVSAFVIKPKLRGNDGMPPIRRAGTRFRDKDLVKDD